MCHVLWFCLLDRNWSIAFPNRPTVMHFHWMEHRTAGHSSPALRWLGNVSENLPNCCLISDMQMTYMSGYKYRGSRVGPSLCYNDLLSSGEECTQGERTKSEPGNCFYGELAHPGVGGVREQRDTGTRIKWDILLCAHNLNLEKVNAFLSLLSKTCFRKVEVKS